jgi:hypothetical protein
MSGRKPYTKPELIQVNLNHEQAILSACSTGTNSAVSGGAGSCNSGGWPVKML